MGSPIPSSTLPPQDHDLERHSHNTTPLLDNPAPASASGHRPIKVFSAIFLSLLFLSSLILLIYNRQPPQLLPKDTHDNGNPPKPSSLIPSSRGPQQGVSEKTFRQFSDISVKNYPWTNAMLSWQRTSYHFQPQKNWMNGRCI